MNESYFHNNGECYFMVHSELKSDHPTLLFIHGLGDSSISYQRYIQSAQLSNFNILAPDLLGFGRSSLANNYSFKHQVEGIIHHIDYLQNIKKIKLTDITIAAHSMGGIHATLLCESSLKKHIKRLVNVEGSITQYGSFVSEQVMEASEDHNFSEWFSNFKDTIYKKLLNESIAFRYYYASLLFGRSEAFFQNAIEMRELSLALSDKFSNLMGQRYKELKIPKIYCYGDSMCKETLGFLKESNLAMKYFPAKSHFVMIECFNEFVDFLVNLIKQKN